MDIENIIDKLLKSDEFREKIKPFIEEIVKEEDDKETKNKRWFGFDKSKKISELEKKLTDKENDFSVLKGNNEILVEKNTTLHSKLKNVSDEKENYLKLYNEINAELILKNKELTNVEKSFAEEKEKNEELKKQEISLSKELQDEKNKLIKLQTKLDEEIRTKDNEISKFNNSLEKKDKEISKLENSLRKKDNKISELEEFKNELKNHRKIYELVHDDDELQLGYEIEDFETFVLASGNRTFLKKIHQKLRSNCLNNINNDSMFKAMKLYIKSVAKAEDVEVEIIEAKKGDAHDCDRYESTDEDKDYISKCLIPGYKFDDDDDEELIKAVVETKD